MRKRHKGFGLELDAILSAKGNDKPGSAPAAESLQHLSIGAIRPNPFQPRTVFEPGALEELARSIGQQGVIQPIVVRRAEDSGYELVAGERRWRASQAAGLDKIPAIVRDIGDRETLAVALVENIQREDLNTMDEARSLKKLVEEFELSHGQAGDAVGRSRSAVSNLLRLLELAPSVQKLVESGSLEMGHARALLALAPADQSEVAQQVVKKNMTVRQTERLVRLGLEGVKRVVRTTVVIEPPLNAHWRSRITVTDIGKGRVTATLRQLSKQEYENLVEFLRRH